MQTVKHRELGVGEVIHREVKSGRTQITVRFENGKTQTYIIPESFTQGALEAMGDLKDEVDAAIAADLAKMQAKAEEIRARRAAATHPTTTRPATARKKPGKPAAPVTVKDSIESMFETYLANAGYKECTDSGNPSTVSAYSRAVKVVLEDEGLTWRALQCDIDNVVPMYDVNGAKQLIGAKSNNTVINALKRFQEFTKL